MELPVCALDSGRVLRQFLKPCRHFKKWVANLNLLFNNNFFGSLLHVFEKKNKQGVKQLSQSVVPSNPPELTYVDILTGRVGGSVNFKGLNCQILYASFIILFTLSRYVKLISLDYKHLYLLKIRQE